MADFLKIGKLIENLTGYIKVKIEILKLDIIEEVSKGVARIFANLIILVLSLFFLAFFNLAAAVLLNSYLDSDYIGYLIIAAVYFVMLLIVIIMAKNGRLKKMIEDQIVRSRTEQNATNRSEDE
ncbi:MAG: phage holin family protein [Cyclobacteriaceae bacterium]